MTISGALSNALSGLTASARAAGVAASNVANVMTEGYGVRDIQLAPRAVGDAGGVQVLGITRLVDQVLLADRRSAEATLAAANTEHAFYERVQVAIGVPTETGSMGDKVAQLEAALTEATRAPESEPHLLRVNDSLGALVGHINDLGDAVQAERMRADNAIATEVDLLNSNLERLEDLNARVRKQTVLGHDVSALLDERQVLVDQVNAAIPVTVLERGQGSIALMAEGGTLLLDGSAGFVTFSETPVITPHQTVTNGTLSELMLNGRVVPTSGDRTPIAGGRLATLFEIRDETGVALQAQIDGFARDLVERFEDPAVDPTLAATDPGLLTDYGAQFDPLNEVGLAQRLSVNAAVDPSAGGEVWRLRDGLGATVPGPEGSSDILLGLSDALVQYQTPSSAAFTGGSRTAATLASDISSYVGGGLIRSDTGLSFAQAQFDTLKDMELSEGVDSDAEMQKLLLIEQAYAANARVVQTVDEMLDWLMRIGA